jgi:hypothetical protein
MVFYVMGGGYASAGMLIFGPISGLVLGPWAGFVAGVIGGLIGMFISPGSYPLGLLDVFLSGAALPIFYGLAHPRYRKYYIPLVVLLIVWIAINPYFWPGAAGGFEPADPTYLLSFLWGPVGLIVYLLFQKRALRMTENSKIPTQFIGYLLYLFGPLTAWLIPWENVYKIMLKFPLQVARLENIFSWIQYIPAMLVGAAIVSLLLINALRRSKLMAVPGSLLDKSDETN